MAKKKKLSKKIKVKKPYNQTEIFCSNTALEQDEICSDAAIQKEHADTDK